MTQLNFIKKGLALGIVLLFITTGCTQVLAKQDIIIATKSISVPQQRNVDNTITLTNIANSTKHLLLLHFIELIFALRLVRGDLFYGHSLGYIRDTTIIIHPLLFLRGIWLQASAFVWLSIWVNVSRAHNWGWDEPLFQWALYVITHFY